MCTRLTGGLWTCRDNSTATTHRWLSRRWTRSKFGTLHSYPKEPKGTAISNEHFI